MQQKVKGFLERKIKSEIINDKTKKNYINRYSISWQQSLIGIDNLQDMAKASENI